MPTHVIRPETEVQLKEVHSHHLWVELRSDGLFSFAGDNFPSSESVAKVIDCLSQADSQSMPVQALAQVMRIESSKMIRTLAPMAKLGFVSFVAFGGITNV